MVLTGKVWLGFGLELCTLDINWYFLSVFILLWRIIVAFSFSLVLMYKYAGTMPWMLMLMVAMEEMIYILHYLFKILTAPEYVIDSYQFRTSLQFLRMALRACRQDINT